LENEEKLTKTYWTCRIMLLSKKRCRPSSTRWTVQGQSGWRRNATEMIYKFMKGLL